jgi:hypothetical protein
MFIVTSNSRFISNRPSTSRWGCARVAATNGMGRLIPHPSLSATALQLIAGYEDPMHPGRGSA